MLTLTCEDAGMRTDGRGSGGVGSGGVGASSGGRPRLTRPSWMGGSVAAARRGAGEAGVPLRRRVLLAIVAITTLAVALFAVPLAVAMSRRYREETVSSALRDAPWMAT